MSYVSHLSCSVCGADYPAGKVMNLCEHDNRPIQMILDLDRLKAEVGRDGWWSPSRRDLWRFGGLLPLDITKPEDRRHVVSRGEGCTPCLPYAHPLAEKLGCRLEVKDEGKHYRGFRGQSDAFVQGPGDDDDRGDGPVARSYASGCPHSGKRR